MRIKEEPMPQPAAGEELVRVLAVGICGSDVHWWHEGGIGSAHIIREMVLGHEGAGVIESGPRRGTLVAIDPQITCGHCDYCAVGKPNLCRHVRFPATMHVDGLLQEYIVWPSHFLLPLPPGLSAADGAMLEPLGIGLLGVDLGHVHPADTVGIYGAGTIGLMTLQIARLAGARRIIMTDLLPERLDVARKLGATDVFMAEGGAEIAKIWQASGGEGLDVTFEAAGEASAVDVAIETCRPGGSVVMQGIPAEERMSFDAHIARERGLSIMMQRRATAVYPRTIALAEAGMVDLRTLATHVFPLGRAQEAYEFAHARKGIKVIIDPQA